MRDFDPTASEFISSGYLKDSRPGGLLFDFGAILQGASLVSGLMGSGAANSAADQQAASGQAAINETRAAQAKAEQYLNPYLQSGEKYNALLQRYMGVGQKNGPGSAAYEQALGIQRQRAIAAGADPSDPNFEKNLALEVQAGVNRDSLGGAEDSAYGSLLKPFDQTDLNNDLVYQNGLQFGLDTGINQLNNLAAASGGYGSGAALKALTRYGNDYATTKTEGAYNRNASNKNQIYSFISGGANQGQAAATSLGQSGMNAAQSIGNNLTGIGNAEAAGTVGSANSISNGLAGATNAYQWNQLLNKGKSGTGSNYASSEPYSGYFSSIGGA